MAMQPPTIDRASEDLDDLRREVAFRDVEIIRLREIIRRLRARTMS